MPGSATAPGRVHAGDGACARVAFHHLNGVGTQDIVDIAAQWLACAYPCQRFATHLTVRHA